MACSLVCTQKERALFKPQQCFYPTEKGAGSFLIWAIDSMVGLHPPHPDTGATSAVIATDCFHKWLEGAPMARLDSLHTVVQEGLCVPRGFYFDFAMLWGQSLTAVTLFDLFCCIVGRLLYVQGVSKVLVH